MATQKTIDSADPVVRLYNGFCVGFENAFTIDAKGNLKCDRVTRRNVQAWYQQYRLLVMVITGVDVPATVGAFEESTQGDINALNKNKKVLLAYYSIAFSAYLKYSQIIKREANRNFLPPAQVIVADEPPCRSI